MTISHMAIFVYMATQQRDLTILARKQLKRKHTRTSQLFLANNYYIPFAQQQQKLTLKINNKHS